MLNTPRDINEKTSDAVARLSKPVVIVLLANLGALLLFSYWLAGHRLYQVDECQNMFVARLLATGKADDSYTGITLFVAPLAWLAGRATNSSEMFAQGRLVGLTIFWLNVFLLTLATQKRLFSAQGLIALQGAATLAPLWDYGFEIRHDNLMLTGLLLMWCAMRIVPSRPAGYFAVGMLAVGIQFVALKAFVYCLPILAIGLAAIARFPRRVVLKLVLASIAGGVGAFLIVRLAYGAAGWWDLYIRDLQGISNVVPRGYIFGPLRTLRRLIIQTPLLVILATFGMISSAAQAWRYRRIKVSLEGLLPEALLLFVAFAALFANPTPFPYNLVNLVPFAFLLAFRYGTTLVQNVSADLFVRPVIVGVVVIGHLLPFAMATYRHVGMTNERQKTLMQAAEALTEPARDPVYDGVGMVPTRDSIHGLWLLHTLNVRTFIDGPAPHIREMLDRKPAAVIIPSYRTDWLPSDDHAFIRDRYLPLADDFWVLGTILPAGGGAFQIVHSGRYRVYTLGSPPTESRPAELRSLVLPQQSIHPQGTLDGKPLITGAVELSLGTHLVECPRECIYAVVWLGPRLRDVPQIGEGDHRSLFVNWY